MRNKEVKYFWVFNKTKQIWEPKRKYRYDTQAGKKYAKGLGPDCFVVKNIYR